MITEQQQREAYEFIYPELKEHPKWTLYTSEFDDEYPEAPATCTITVCHTWEGDAGWSPIRWGVPSFYTRDGQPDMNTWYYEFVPRLEAEGVHVDYNSENKDTALYCYKHGVYAVTMWKGRAPDPYAAFSQWREAR